MSSKRILGVVIAITTIIILSISSKPDLMSNSMSKIIPDRHHGGPGGPERPEDDFKNHKPPRERHNIVNKTFLLSKTGIEVAYSRLPPHFETTFDTYPHHAVYADTNDTIDGMPMIDAIAFLDERTLNCDASKAYRIRRQIAEHGWNWKEEKIMMPGDANGGWNLDRFKNVPAFAHAYLLNPNMNWYVMIDADSYLPASTSKEVVGNRNPHEPLYFGKAVGVNPPFAHGGSGIIFSRGAMRMMFGDSQESMDAAMARAGQNAEWNCCGDSVSAHIYADATGKDTSDTSQMNEVGQFQGNPISVTHVTWGEWCNPVGSFHASHPWEVEVLYDWEVSKKSRRITYAHFYNDFISPEVVAEKPNWYASYSNMGINTRVFNSGDIESRDKQKCIDMCKDDPDCTMWEFLGNEACILFRDCVSLGKAMNPYSDSWNPEWSECTTGYMVDRIQQFRRSQDCVKPSKDEEGWRYMEHAPGDVHLRQTKFDVANRSVDY